MAFSLLNIAIIEAESSGMLVPIEITEILTIRSLTPIDCAIETADPTNTSAPNQRQKLPKSSSPIIFCKVNSI